MTDKYFRVYQVDFDEYSIEITYPVFEQGFNMNKTIGFKHDMENLDKLIDLLVNLGFTDLSNDIEGENI